MGYREIDRSQANDGQGDDARTWSGKTNENMKELFSRNFMLNGVRVSRESYDPSDLKFDQFIQYDELTGWEDSVAKTRRVSGVIMQLPFTWPDDIDDEAKFFITNDRNR
jgi:hypothetical protein